MVFVNCRIGSLESCVACPVHSSGVNCRIGSLEILDQGERLGKYVNCRIGSLENHFIIADYGE